MDDTVRPGRVRPPDAQERLTILETEQRHLIKTQDALLSELRDLRSDFSKLSTVLMESVTKWNTTANVGMSALSLWTRAVVFIMGGLGTLVGAAFMIAQATGAKITIH